VDHLLALKYRACAQNAFTQGPRRRHAGSLNRSRVPRLRTKCIHAWGQEASCYRVCAQNALTQGPRKRHDGSLNRSQVPRLRTKCIHAWAQEAACWIIKPLSSTALAHKIHTHMGPGGGMLDHQTAPSYRACAQTAFTHGPRRRHAGL